MRAVRQVLERRRAMIETERQLQAALRGGQLSRAKFRRNYRFGPYTLALYCEVYQLAVVVNLSPPAPAPQPDVNEERRKFLESRGLRVVTVNKTETLDISGVLAKIVADIGNLPVGG